MNILSLFDGMSCGQIALNRAGIKYENYFASEIDKDVIKITMKNFPNTKQTGDVTKIKSSDLPQIDLIIGGSPCQGFSLAGKQLNFNDPRSKLFFEYLRLLKECKPKYFLLENVVMKEEHSYIISKQLAEVFPEYVKNKYLFDPILEPVLINSSLFSAQNRERLYWSNIPINMDIKDKKIYLKDVWCGGIDITKTMLSKKPGTLSYIKAWSSVRTLNQKSKTLIAGGQGVSNSGATNVLINGKYYKPGVKTCERLQTVPDDYTVGVSNTQRYKMLGNGWTVDVISYILSYLNKKD
jgi:DNA-cytosine methyltransferase